MLKLCNRMEMFNVKLATLEMVTYTNTQSAGDS